MKSGPTYTLPVSSARARLSEIVLKVQDPRSSFILTRRGKPVAAVVSMEELERIWSEQEIADILANRTPVEGGEVGVKVEEVRELVEQNRWWGWFGLR